MDEWAQHITGTPTNARVPLGRPGETYIGRCKRLNNARNGTASTMLSFECSGAGTSNLKEQTLNKTNSGLTWRAVFALMAGVCQQALCWGMIMTFGSILTFYTHYLLPGISKKALSLVGALQPFFVLGMSLLWGRLLDAGYHRKVNAFAGVCLTAGLTSLAFTGGKGKYGDGHYLYILLASIPIGIGQSCYFVAAPHMAKTWWPARKGLAMGITNSGAAIGGVLWPLVFTEMTARYSFRTGIGTLAAITSALGAFIACASTPSPSFERRPIGEWRLVRTWLPIKGLQSMTFLIHITGMCCVYMGILTIPFFIEYWAQANNLGTSEDSLGKNGKFHQKGPLTVYLVVILNASQFPGRLLASALCDKVRARKIHVVSCVVAIIVTSTLWIRATSYNHACIFAAFFGLTLGAMASLPINDAAEILGPHRQHLLGQYAGVVYTISSPFILGGAVISGAFVDSLHNHVAGIWAIACFTACAVLLTITLVLPDDTWKFDGGNEERVENFTSDDATLRASDRIEKEQRESV